MSFTLDKRQIYTSYPASRGSLSRQSNLNLRAFIMPSSPPPKGATCLLLVRREMDPPPDGVNSDIVVSDGSVASSASGASNASSALGTPENHPIQDSNEDPPYIAGKTAIKNPTHLSLHALEAFEALDA